MIVSDNRLREIGETVVEDYHDLAHVVCELAVAILERGLGGSVPQSAPAPPIQESKRLPGKPLGDKLPHPCPRCQADVVTFISKRTGKPYQCDVEVGYFNNLRTVLTASNWLHRCGGGK